MARLRRPADSGLERGIRQATRASEPIPGRIRAVADSRRSPGRAALALAALAATVLLVVWPLGELLAVSLERLAQGDSWRELSASAVSNTLMVGSAASAVTVALGMAAAHLTERSATTGRRWLRLGILLPILIPPFVSALSWIRAYGRGGLLDDLVGVSLPGLFGPLGVIAVVSINALPLAYLLIVAGINTRAERDLELAARVHGAGPVTAARTVTAPLLAPALVGSAALVFIVGINAFGAPAILGTPASFETVTTRIYQDLALSSRPEAFGSAILLATGLVSMALLFAVAAEWALRDLGRPRRTGPAAGASRLPRGRNRLSGVAAWVAIGLLTLLPLAALVLSALTRGVGVAPTLSNLTLANFAEALDSRFLGALGRSSLLALVAAVTAVALGGLVAWAQANRGTRYVGVLVLLSFAVPGSTLAVAMLLSYGSVLRDTLFIILLAYLAKLWAVGHRAIAGSSGNIPEEIVFAARNSGATGTVALRTVTIPLLRPALVGAAILVFVIGFHELTMSSLLYGPGTDTLAVAVLNLQQLGDVPVTSALAVILTVPLLLAAVPLLAWGSLPRRIMGTG